MKPTRTGPTSGQVLFFRFVSKATGVRFIHQSSHTLSNGAVTSLACLDIDGDGLTDVVAGTQTGTASGQLLYLQNRDLGVPMNFSLSRKVDAPGIVTSLIAGDFGGGSRMDVAMGWRSSDTGYGGGVQIYFCDLGSLPFVGVDPSGGALFNFVPALTVNNFNYGVYPTTPTPPHLTDLAAGVKRIMRRASFTLCVPGLCHWQPIRSLAVLDRKTSAINPPINLESFFILPGP